MSPEVWGLTALHVQCLLRFLNPKPESLCTIMYTGGNTGNLKVGDGSFLRKGIGLLVCNEESGKP